MLSMIFVTATVSLCNGMGEDLTLQTLCEMESERVESLFQALDLNYPGLEPARDTYEAGDLPGACGALLDYYRRCDTAQWLRRPQPERGEERDPGADTVLAGRFTLYGVEADVPLRPDGGLDWSFNGPENDPEWGWALNRHPWAIALLSAYFKTGNPVYAEGFDRMVGDWILANPYPGAKSRTPQWRGLEAFFRLTRSWSDGFYALQECAEFSDATRILVLSSVPEHAHYARNFHAAGGNWVTMEMNGLATAAACWPEFRDAPAWLDYACSRMTTEMGQQVYPDGVQKELTSHYHYVALLNFDEFASLSQRAGRALPDAFSAGIERMFHYMAYAIRPSGYGPLNNDSNLDYNRDRVLAAAARFKRKDWRYIATNGAEGTAPEGPPSALFPWAGQLIMRSGYDADAHWAFFDAGPFGTGHQHHDKLHLSVRAGGRDILVDAGRYTYVGGPWREYFVGSPSHNVLLVDGKGQNEYAREADQPISDLCAVAPEYDYARGVFDAGYEGVEGTAAHTRVVVYLRNQYWVIVDRFDTDRPRSLSALWHFHPDCTVEVSGVSAASVDTEKGNVCIVPVGPLTWSPQIVKGQAEPAIQGWWSVEYGKKDPSPCVVYAAACDGPATFAWVIMPATGIVPRFEARLVSGTPESVTLRVERHDGPAQELAVSMTAPVVTITEPQ